MTPPADPAALSIAVATVRRCASRLPGHPANALEYETYTAATELLAREFVRLLDAGELHEVLESLASLEVTPTEIFQEEKYGNRGIFGKGDGMISVRDVLIARRLAAALKPLIVEARP